jgi:cyanate permease
MLVGERMENKFIRTVIAGVIAGLVKDLPNAVLSHYRRLTEVALWEYAGVIALGRIPRGFSEQCYAFILELLFGIFLGLIFVNIPFLCKNNYNKLRGVLFGAFVWFVVRAAVLAFNICDLLHENLGNSLLNLVESMLFGCVFVSMGRFLERRRILDGQ